jgi:hypothetical protein
MGNGTQLVTGIQRQHVYERLLHRNHIRSQMGMKPIDIPRMYHRKVHAIEIAEYETLLKPYLVKAFADIAWPDSFTGRILIAVRLHKQCVDQVHMDHGIVDPSDRRPDMVAMINRLVPSAPVTLLSESGCSDHGSSLA